MRLRCLGMSIIRQQPTPWPKRYRPLLLPHPADARTTTAQMAGDGQIPCAGRDTGEGRAHPRPKWREEGKYRARAREPTGCAHIYSPNGGNRGNSVRNALKFRTSAHSQLVWRQMGICCARNPGIPDPRTPTSNLVPGGEILCAGPSRQRVHAPACSSVIRGTSLSPGRRVAGSAKRCSPSRVACSPPHPRARANHPE
jgi:hypothetical protein